MGLRSIFFDKSKLINAKKRLYFPKTFFDKDNFEAYETIFSNVMLIDAHSHIGHDKDGHGTNEKNFIENMKMAHVNRAIVFPLNEPKSGNFSRQNERIHKFHVDNPTSIIPFFRLNPKTKWRKECQKRIGQGFMGIKLHPRSQKFEIASREAMGIYEVAEKNNLPVLIHAGFGLENIAADIKKVAMNFPKLKMILGHGAFVDFENTAKAVGKNDNVVFDTSTLRTFDLLNMIDTLDYSRIVFGSDFPYYDFGLALEMAVDAAILCNKSPSQIKAILGTNILRWFK